MLTTNYTLDNSTLYPGYCYNKVNYVTTSPYIPTPVHPTIPHPTHPTTVPHEQALCMWDNAEDYTLIPYLPH